ncbi:MAG: hypothetical protein HQL73_02155 [Magnetococcales bacterium]|nr:hypothetical protein [Magnetococcales bacterium]
MNIRRFSMPLLLGKVRRFLMVRFRPNIIAQRALLRQGECHRCAICCQLLYRCPMLSKDNLCMIYHSTLRPTVCQHFPLDHRDLNDVARMGVGCGYVFPRQSGERTASQDLANLPQRQKPSSPLGELEPRCPSYRQQVS